MTNRTSARQGTTVRLYINIKRKSLYTDPADIGTVEILNTQGTSLVSGITPEKESDGVYFIEYAISPTAVTGEYIDRWSDVVYDVGLTPVDIDLNFYVQESSWGGSVPKICDVTILAAEMDGDPRIGIEGTAKIVSAPYEYNDSYYSSNYEGTATSDSNGKMVFSLVYGATVRVEIPDLKISKVFVVPAQPLANLNDIEEI